MSNKNDLKEDEIIRPAFTKQFMGDIAERLGDEIRNVLDYYGLPEVKKAVETYTVLHMLMGEDPESSWVPDGLEGYDREVTGNIQDASWHIHEMTVLIRAKYREEKRKAGPGG